MPTPVGPPVILPSATVRALSERSSWQGALQLAVHTGALSMSMAALWTTWGTLWTVPLWVSTGVLWNHLYAAQHELSHGTVFRSRRANELWGRIIGFTQLYPRDYDRHHHLRHHRFTGDPEHDAELAFRTPYTLGSYLMYLLGPAYWWGRLRALVETATGRFGAYPMPPSVAARIGLEARVHLFLYALLALVSWATGSWVLVVLWLGPMLTLKVTHQLQNTVEHTGMPMTGDLQQSTRTVRAPWPWRRLMWNMTWHTAHHAYPSVPFYRLPALDHALRARGMMAVHTGYLSFQARLLARLARGESV